MIYRAIAVVGIFLSLAGVILLWRSSPSGNSLGAYANDALLRQIANQNRRLRRRQIFAQTLIFVGSACQIPLIFFA